ncbi:transcriptional repressor LexA [Streptomyces sp. NPDC102476]|uniref:transcriptional repressor LexA n=1 Tax=Streptomyces sp. NPDC102476 TaxID=3366181 RepID=UPI003815F618
MGAITNHKNIGRPPGIRTGTDGLTKRQRDVIACITDSVHQRGYPPSMREIGQATGLASTSSVAHQLMTLEKKGLLRRDPHRPRCYVPVHAPDPDPSDDQLAGRAAEAERAAAMTEVPLIGRIAAGMPITAEQHVDARLSLPRRLVGHGDLFALTVTGDSMIGAHITSGDQVVIRAQPTAENGEIVAAMLDSEATVKRLKLDGESTWLIPENDAFTPIRADQATILGKVVAVVRTL